MHIIGTAGHVDHGKSSLVAALTGTNPDRWIEEQLRGMTLDLGFAHLPLPNGVEAGIVDVPGHERFLHNMLAGAAGMELLMLVVAANEGVMPQTLEHLAILRYLNVQRSLLVITKTDLLDADALPRVQAQITADLSGTLVDGVPVVAVSTQTGAGLGALRETIAAELAKLPERSKDAPAYLPIDRVFALAGHGTIVTGTLMQGKLAVGDQLQVAPQGLQARVRSLHVFGESRRQVSAGSRVAINLPGIDTSQLRRGDVLADGQFVAAQQFRVNFEPLPEALPLLRRRNPVRAYIGAAEVLGTLVFDEVPQLAQPRQAMLHLRRGVAVYPRANFVLRRMSPKTLLGGGFVRGAEDSHPAVPGLDPLDEAVLAVLAQSPDAVLTAAEIASRANLREDVVLPALGRLGDEQRLFAVAKPPGYISGHGASELFKRLTTFLYARQKTMPWVLGITSLALSREIGVAEDVLVRLLAAFADRGEIAARSGYYATVDHTAKLTDEQRTFFEDHLLVDAQNPYLPVSLAGLVASVRSSKIAGLSQAFDTLVARGAIVKVGEDVYRGTQIAGIHARLEESMRKNPQITMSGFRDLIGTSRKFAVPLLEWFDARGVTVRSGDFRMLRTKRA
ncbi:MAG: selenocysteine-specific translation elongation factor [Candidatus Baltobacteraceae bacterium]